MQKFDFLLVVSLLCAAACSSDEDDVPREIKQFFDDFHASRYSQSSARAAELDAAAEADPGHGPLSFDRALAHNWHVQEWRRDPKQDPAALQAEAQSLPGLFQTAYENNPDDPRVGCFLGLQLVGAGRATSSGELLEQGIAVLDQAVADWPEFNLFCLGLAYDQLPASHPDYGKAVAAAFDNVDACVGERIDRAVPDLAPYLGLATTEGPKRACWNGTIAPHNAEGFYLWIGDLLVKQGNVDAARVMYDNVKLIEEYPDWPYRSLLEDRLGDDLEAKAALYQDADPGNDPLFGGEEASRRCAVCHAATADE